MIREYSVVIGPGAVWAWLTAAGLCLAVLFFLALCVVVAGYGIVKAEKGKWRFVIGGLLPLIFIPFFVSMIIERFTAVSRVDVGGDGVWTLRAAAGNVIAAIPPEEPRSFTLWLSSSRSSLASRRTDALEGGIEADGKRYEFAGGNKAFDLLEQFGYGPVLIRRSTAAQETAGKILLYIGTGEAEAWRSPPHRYDAEGIAVLKDALAG